MRLLDESSRLNAGAAEKIEQAAGLVSGAKEKKGLTVLAASISNSAGICFFTRRPKGSHKYGIDLCFGACRAE